MNISMLTQAIKQAIPSALSMYVYILISYL